MRLVYSILEGNICYFGLLEENFDFLKDSVDENRLLFL